MKKVDGGRLEISMNQADAGARPGEVFEAPAGVSYELERAMVSKPRWRLKVTCPSCKRSQTVILKKGGYTGSEAFGVAVQLQKHPCLSCFHSYTPLQVEIRLASRFWESAWRWVKESWAETGASSRRWL